MDFVGIVSIEFNFSIASLALISAGLAIIFGMMRVINFAHGEFMMIGALSSILLTRAGVNFWLASLIVSPLIVGLLGAAVERFLIRRLYGQMIATLLATWGLSFFLIGLATSIFGNSAMGISIPLDSISIGQHRTSLYTLFVILISLMLFVGIFSFFRYSQWGMLARGAMQDPIMAAALGVDTPRLYTITFGVGSAITGLAGAVLAPYAGVVPTMGTAYVAKAFITVITGGPNAVLGTTLSATFYGLISQTFTMISGPIIGEVALLLSALVILRILPQGFTGRHMSTRL